MLGCGVFRIGLLHVLSINGLSGPSSQSTSISAKPSSSITLYLWGAWITTHSPVAGLKIGGAVQVQCCCCANRGSPRTPGQNILPGCNRLIGMVSSRVVRTVTCGSGGGGRGITGSGIPDCEIATRADPLRSAFPYSRHKYPKTCYRRWSLASCGECPVVDNPGSRRP